MQYAKPVTLNVEECDRLSFLPYLFGNDFLYAEAYVYALAQKMMPFTGCAMRSCGVTSNFTPNATRFTRHWTD